MKREELIRQMTIEEKAACLSGKTVWQTWDFPRLGIPSIFCSDGPHGIRKQAGAGDHLGLNASLPATCFPTAATVANSWDEALAEEIGMALGEEAAAQQVHVLLGPGLNIKRSPLCGRNFEYFSEDPYLSGKMAAAYVRGIQSQGVYACPKHFAVNSQELRRMAMNAVIDERTLREIYLTGFEIAVKEGGARAIMSSYNEVNGTYVNENRHLMVDILREEWGFDGIVITDWGGSNSHTAGVAARSNLEMPCPGLDSARELVKAVETGKLSMEELDTAVDDLLDAVMTLSSSGKETPSFDEEAHHRLARRAAAESAVLLKNAGQMLPLKKGTRVAVIGDFALQPRYQGAGSSMVNAIRLETIAQLVGEYELEVVGISGGYQRSGEQDVRLAEEAKKLAAEAEVVLYCFGLDELSESEGLDRSHMQIPQNQILLLEELAKANGNVVGILSAGSAIEMPWENCCRAILHGYLGGQAGAGAMLDILTGRVNPSGKLNETYPMCYEDTPAFWYYPAEKRNSEYREGIFVGYRYYDTSKKEVRYPFGYGLSYTSFAYRDLTIDEQGAEFTLQNTGSVDGAETAQLYVGLPDGAVFRPAKELKGFCKVFLKAGESRRIRIPFDDKTFRYWNVKTDCWETEGGAYQISIGASCADIRLQALWSKAGTGAALPYEGKCLPSYDTGRIEKVGRREYESMLGTPIPEDSWNGELTENDAICQMYYAKSGLARMIYRILTRRKEQSEAKGKPDLNILFIYNMPFRGIAKMTNGAVSMEMVHGMVDAANGRFWSGMKQIICGYVRNGRENKAYLKKITGK
ncbi:MAG: glycoside hydrolase family 3 C-terminal domain-containing protein [Eubacteriales bacterium]|nr:glycoside hydrolase family 3 C-terminal domain-containing protein [Eubacteriales bacterium]